MVLEVTPPAPPQLLSGSIGSHSMGPGQGSGAWERVTHDPALSCSLAPGWWPRRARRGRDSVCKQGGCQEGARTRGVCEGDGAQLVTTGAPADSSVPATCNMSLSQTHTHGPDCPHTQREAPKLALRSHLPTGASMLLGSAPLGHECTHSPSAHIQGLGHTLTHCPTCACMPAQPLVDTNAQKCTLLPTSSRALSRPMADPSACLASAHGAGPKHAVAAVPQSRPSTASLWHAGSPYGSTSSLSPCVSVSVPHGSPSHPPAHHPSLA